MRLERMRQEDSSELFQAALRASRVDLGPRGISQAAKIMATGDETLGQAALVAKTGTHQGAGGRYNRSGASSSSATPNAAGSASAASGPQVARAASPPKVSPLSKPGPIGSLSSSGWKPGQRGSAVGGSSAAQPAIGGPRRPQSSTLRNTGGNVLASGASRPRSPLAKE